MCMDQRRGFSLRILHCKRTLTTNSRTMVKMAPLNKADNMPLTAATMRLEAVSF